jgi:hypothetical protein
MAHTKTIPKFYTLAELIELRRQMLRYARSISRGPERNERRQVADSLRRLFKNKEWLKVHLVGKSATEYRVNIMDPDGSSHQAIKLNSPDDAAAVESAKQFIDGKDIELWQNNRRVVTFAHRPE